MDANVIADSIRQLQVSAYNRRYYLKRAAELKERQRNRYRNDEAYRQSHKQDMLQRYHRQKEAAVNYR